MRPTVTTEKLSYVVAFGLITVAAVVYGHLTKDWSGVPVAATALAGSLA